METQHRVTMLAISGLWMNFIAAAGGFCAAIYLGHSPKLFVSAIGCALISALCGYLSQLFAVLPKWMPFEASARLVAVIAAGACVALIWAGGAAL